MAFQTRILILDLITRMRHLSKRTAIRFQGPEGDSGPTGDPGRPGKDVSIDLKYPIKN